MRMPSLLSLKKSGNIMLGVDGSVMLGDMGVSVGLEGQQRDGSWGNLHSSRMSLVGTPCWTAPEVFEGTGHNSSADIW